MDPTSCPTSTQTILELNKGNKTYVIKYSIILITISLILAIIGIADYHLEWTAKNSELLVALYGINWIVLGLNIMYWINTSQRSNIFGKLMENIKKK